MSWVEGGESIATGMPLHHGTTNHQQDENSERLFREQENAGNGNDQ